jgi:hypothetical protein
MYICIENDGVDEMVWQRQLEEEDSCMHGRVAIELTNQCSQRQLKRGETKTKNLEEDSMHRRVAIELTN